MANSSALFFAIQANIQPLCNPFAVDEFPNRAYALPVVPKIYTTASFCATSEKSEKKNSMRKPKGLQQALDSTDSEINQNSSNSHCWYTWIFNAEMNNGFGERNVACL